LFGLSSGDFLNHKVLVGNDRLFTVTVTEKERMYVEFARELIHLRDGYLSLSNGFVMPREDIQTVFSARQHAERAICYRKSVRLSVCLSVRPSVCHTGGSVKNG